MTSVLRLCRAWYTVFLSALIGSGASACFPQFSMTLYAFSKASGIPAELLLAGETVKSSAIVLAMLISGFVYRKIGCRLTFTLAMRAVILPQGLLPGVSSAALFFALKFIQGMGALSFPLFIVLIMNWMPREHAGLSTAVFNGIFYGGGCAGGTLAGFIIVKSGWQASYYIMALLIALLSLLWLLTIKEHPPGGGAQTPDHRRPAGGGGFLKDYRVWLLALALFGTAWCVQAVTVDMPLYGAFLGCDELGIGAVLGGVTAAMILSCIISGRVSDFFAGKARNRGRARLLVMLGGYGFALAALCFLMVSAAASLAVFGIAAFLFTFGSAWGLGVFYAILPELFEREKVPLAAGFTGGIGDTGMPLAPFFVGAVFGIRGQWRTGWALCAFVVVLSAAAIAVLIGGEKRGVKPGKG